jgi:hypothetical protein
MPTAISKATLTTGLTGHGAEEYRAGFDTPRRPTHTINSKIDEAA